MNYYLINTLGTGKETHDLHYNINFTNYLFFIQTKVRIFYIGTKGHKVLEILKKLICIKNRMIKILNHY